MLNLHPVVLPLKRNKVGNTFDCFKNKGTKEIPMYISARPMRVEPANILISQEDV